MNLLNFYTHAAKNLLSFVAHTLSISLASVILFLFGFYVIPVLAGQSMLTTTQLSSDCYHCSDAANKK